MNKKKITFITEQEDYERFWGFCKRNKITISEGLRRIIKWAPLFLTSPEYNEYRQRVAVETGGRVLLGRPR